MTAEPSAGPGSAPGTATGDETGADAAAEPARPAARPAGRRQGGAPWLVVVLALVFGLLCLAAAGAVVATGGSALGLQTAEDAAAVRASALEAARERTVSLTSYDHTRLDQDFAGVLETAVDPFRTEYSGTTEQLRAVLAESQAVATATVLAAGLEGEVTETEQGERAVVVVAVDQVIATAGAEPRTERNRLRMTLVRPEATWLVQAVERL